MSTFAVHSAVFPPRLPARPRASFAERFWPMIAFLLMALSSFVQSEPAPYDLLLLGSMLLFLLSGPRFPSALIWPGFAILLLLSGYMLGGLSAGFQQDAFTYLRTSTYLTLSLIFFAALIAAAPKKIVTPLAAGLVIASLFAALLGIAGYFGAIPDAESFALYGRASGPFKDPNVFGPSLVFPSLYLMHRMTTRAAREIMWSLPLLLIFLMALLLSFSRGAWTNFFVAVCFFVMASLASAPLPVRRRLFGFILIGTIAAAIALAFAFSFDEVRNQFLQRFAFAQEYDSGEGGRFSNMYAALKMALTHPFGIGPNQWPHFSPVNLMPHNIYVNVFVSGGLLSLIGFASLTVMTLVIGLRAIGRNAPMTGVLIAALAAFSGHAVEGLIIDSNHWRHLYVVMGIVWGLALASETNVTAALRGCIQARRAALQRWGKLPNPPKPPNPPNIG